MQERQERQRSMCSDRLGVGGAAVFEHLLDEVDAPARAVEFVAEQHEGRAGRGAKAAMHAFAQDRLGFGEAGIGELGERKMRLHLKPPPASARARECRTDRTPPSGAATGLARPAAAAGTRARRRGCRRARAQGSHGRRHARRSRRGSAPRRRRGRNPARARARRGPPTSRREPRSDRPWRWWRRAAARRWARPRSSR